MIEEFKLLTEIISAKNAKWLVQIQHLCRKD